MPLSSASPSFGPSATGARPACGERLRGGQAALVGVKASPTPIIAAVMWASGARSPDAPTEPCAGTTGMTPFASMASSSASVAGPHAGGALREAGELQRHHQPHDRHGHRLADAGGVREHDVALERREIGGLDAHAGELPEAGVDAVDGLALGDDAGHGRGAAASTPAPAGRIERAARAAVDGAPLRQRHASRA